MPEKRVIVKSEFREWVNSPVCKVVLEALERKIQTCYDERAEVMYPGEPIKTQEFRMKKVGEEDAYQTLTELLQLDEGAIDELFTLQNIEVLKTKEEEELERYDE